VYTAFERISAERKQRILKVCLQEFAQKGYEKASTNAMVEALGIAKGLLFHYFGSKKGLYLYLWEHTARIFNEELLAHMRHSEGKRDDFFSRIRTNTVVKLRTCLEYPTEYRFLMQSVSGLPQEVEEDLSAVRDKLYALFMQASTETGIGDLSPGNLRKGVSHDMAVKFITMVLDQLTMDFVREYRGREIEVLARPKQIAKVAGLDEVIDMIRNGICTGKDGK
jgi:TetR/AcrR family transcriptional regulator